MTVEKGIDNNNNINDHDNDEEDDEENDQEDQMDDYNEENEEEYGVARGIDFRGVGFVVNVDFPVSISSYTHRIGRTARGGAQGTALSLVSIGKGEDSKVLNAVQLSQNPSSQDGSTNLLTDAAATTASSHTQNTNAMLQPSQLSFDLRELEGFRYRVDDVKKAVSKSAIRDARLAEIKQELLNSQ